MSVLATPAARRAPRTVRLPRALHPGAWWGWALALAVAASRTTNPLLLALLVAVAWVVVSARRADTPWARAFRMYVLLGVVIVLVRVLLRAVLGSGGASVLFTLPRLDLPAWAAGISLGGPVTLESVLGGAYDGLRLAVLILCVGAANALADAKRLLRAVPGALYEAGAALVVSVSLAPQLVDSVRRVRAARRLRGSDDTGVRRLRSLVVPAVEDALERSLQLAAAMDSRGYGRVAALPPGRRWLVRGLVLGGLLGVAIGAYGLLDPTAGPALGLPLLVTGLVTAVAGLGLGGRRVARSRYRPDPWTAAEWSVVGSGALAAAAVSLAAVIDPGSLAPSVAPPVWPSLPWIAAGGIVLAAAPAVLAPPLRVAGP